MKKFRKIVFFIVGILCFTGLAHAVIPRVINYQGKLVDKANNPITGNFLVVFRFYDVENAGLPIWEESHILGIRDGFFNAPLGSLKSPNLNFDKDLWLGVEVAGNEEISPRIKITGSVNVMGFESIRPGPSPSSTHFTQSIALLLLMEAVFILALIFYSSKNKK